MSTLRWIKAVVGRVGFIKVRTFSSLRWIEAIVARVVEVRFVGLLGPYRPGGYCMR